MKSLYNYIDIFSPAATQKKTNNNNKKNQLASYMHWKYSIKLQLHCLVSCWVNWEYYIAFEVKLHLVISCLSSKNTVK